MLVMHLLRKQLYRYSKKQKCSHHIYPLVITAPHRKPLITRCYANQPATALHRILYNALALQWPVLQQCGHKQERNDNGERKVDYYHPDKIRKVGP